jgi:hypothetical protein
LIGIAAFFIHFYWTKIGVAEIWNTAKWSSMRSSFYRTIRHFSGESSSKFVSERPLSNASMYSDGIEDVSFEKKRSNPVVTSYINPPSNTSQNRVSIISYDTSSRSSYAKNSSQPIENTRIHNTHAYNNNNNQRNDLASMIKKQRF